MTSRDQVADLLVADLVVACGTPAVPQAEHALRSVPLLAALKRAGTEHVYADTADVDELAPLVVRDGGTVREIDGNTVNRPGRDGTIRVKFIEAPPRLASVPPSMARSGFLPKLNSRCVILGGDPP
jgi:hypothetical protein